MFEVRTDEFEGPLDTLLSLIKKRELYINDISLAEVTDDYLSFITENGDTLHNKSEFVRIAATLVLVKSKSLLPDPDLTEEEAEEINELEGRLKAYKLLKERTETLKEIFGKAPMLSPRSKSRSYDDIFAPGSGLTIAQLAQKATAAIVNLPKESLPTARVEAKISLDAEIDRLKERLKAADNIAFSGITRSQNKHHQVVSFVAMLELIKSGEISANQRNTFSEIHIKNTQ